MASAARLGLALLAAGGVALVSVVVTAQSGGSGSDARAAAPQAPSAAPDAGARPPSAGYSWRDRPGSKRAARRRRPKLDPSKPLATYPGFRMMPDGTSQIWLRVSKQVRVEVRSAPGRVSYLLPEVQVGVHNNTNPLVTTHFDTPVSRARLARTKSGAMLVVELREPVQPTHQLLEGPRGSSVLVVKLPRAARRYSDPVPPPPAR